MIPAQFNDGAAYAADVYQGGTFMQGVAGTGQVILPLGPADSTAEAVSQAMRGLEMLTETDHLLACILMSYLWSVASDQKLHDVCHAIDLWLHDCSSVALKQHLQTLALSEPDPAKRMHYEQLINK